MRNPIPNGWRSGLSSGRVGAIHEFIVCADLLKRGLSIFRAVSPSEHFDLAVCRAGIHPIYRVEVTTGYSSSSGRLMHPKIKKIGSGSFDLLAIVSRNNPVVAYDPPLETFFSNLP